MQQDDNPLADPPHTNMIVFKNHEHTLTCVCIVDEHISVIAATRTQCIILAHTPQIPTTQYVVCGLCTPTCVCIVDKDIPIVAATGHQCIILPQEHSLLDIRLHVTVPHTSLQQPARSPTVRIPPLLLLLLLAAAVAAAVIVAVNDISVCAVAAAAWPPAAAAAAATLTGTSHLLLLLLVWKPAAALPCCCCCGGPTAAVVRTRPAVMACC
jgi:hypothetical protein